jgi:hypothetical protein
MKMKRKLAMRFLIRIKFIRNKLGALLAIASGYDFFDFIVYELEFCI